ncbi:hypothetical protein B0A49_00532 [Cryomyces minteri]|uniref:Maleylacetoacetate isomerase n=1 Tax=Cryomyces minteri TaxID=331657 RepID=A0A4U0Y251_9PEZI|nr:hypothetical protein B0A49_00532 [Cryomyces minteri]
MSHEDPKFVLWGYYRSSCAGRLRIALDLKSVDFENAFVRLDKDEQLQDHWKAVNPSGAVPVLVATSREDTYAITQSVAALEYLEEVLPDRRSLLPMDPVARAKVRVLVNIIACDTQPISNRHIMLAVNDIGASGAEWSKKYISRGLAAYEKTVGISAGKYSVGDEITLADVCLVPAVWAAQRWGVDFEPMPVVSRIFETLSRDPAVMRSHWACQPDTPDELRNKG